MVEFLLAVIAVLLAVIAGLIWWLIWHVEGMWITCNVASDMRREDFTEAERLMQKMYCSLTELEVAAGRRLISVAGRQ